MPLIGIVLLAALVAAPAVMANIDRISGVNVTVQNVIGGPVLNAIMIGDANGTVIACSDTDGRFNTVVKGDLNATFTDRNGMFNYSDRCLDANTLLEFACGEDVNVNGGIALNNNAYAFLFNCADLNQTCSSGRCV